MVLMNTVLMVILVISIMKQQKVQNTLERLIVDIRISEHEEIEKKQAVIEQLKQQLEKKEKKEILKTM